MELLTQYRDIEKKIYQHFGFEPPFNNVPIIDNTHRHWMTVDGTTVWSVEPLTVKSVQDGGAIFSAPTCKDETAYTTTDETMVAVDTKSNGSRSRMIFLNANKCVREDLKQVYRDNWK